MKGHSLQEHSPLSVSQSWFSPQSSPAVQAAPVYFDRDASTERAVGLIREAAQKGADLVAFGETWLPGYPFFRNAGGAPIRHRAAAEYIRNAVEIPGPTTERLCDVASWAAIENSNLQAPSGSFGARVMESVFMSTNGPTAVSVV